MPLFPRIEGFGGAAKKGFFVKGRFDSSIFIKLVI